MQQDNTASLVASVVLLPGLMCDHAFWQPLRDTLAPSMDVRVIDYGTADTLVAMAQAGLAAAPPRFALAGHSMGGRVALEMARIAPERIARLILMDTGYLARAPGDEGSAEQAGRLSLVDVARQEGVRAMCARWVTGMVHPDRLDDAALIGTITEMFERKSAGLFARQQQALLERPDASDVLSALGMPCMLLCGRQDSWANVSQHEAMRTLVPHALLTVIEDAGHMVLMEQPGATVAAIQNFLQSPTGAAC